MWAPATTAWFWATLRFRSILPIDSGLALTHMLKSMVPFYEMFIPVCCEGHPERLKPLGSPRRPEHLPGRGHHQPPPRRFPHESPTQHRRQGAGGARLAQAQFLAGDAAVCSPANTRETGAPRAVRQAARRSLRHAGRNRRAPGGRIERPARRRRSATGGAGSQSRT